MHANVLDSALKNSFDRRAPGIPDSVLSTRNVVANHYASGGGGQVLKGVSAQEGAAAILKLLVEEGVVR